MNVLYHFRTRGTGAEAVHISGIANSLDRLGHKVTFSSPTGIDPRQSAGTNPFANKQKANRPTISQLAHKLPGFLFELMELGYNVVAWKRNRALIQQHKVDWIYERHAFFLFSSISLSRQYRLPLVVEVNELLGDARVRSQPVLSFLVKWIDKKVFQQATAIVVVSPYLKRRIEAMGIPGEKVLVQPNAVDAQTVIQPANPERFRPTFGGEDAVVVGFIGWFVEWHKLDRLVGLVAELAKTRPNLHLVLVGDGTLKEQLQEEAKKGGIADRVHFTGAVPHKEIDQAIAAMDVCVVPHSNEYRSPIKLFEYMAQGRLTVAPNTEPIATVVRDGENGLLFTPDSADDLAKALQRAVDDSELRKRVGQQARQDVLDNYTWERNAEEVLQTLPFKKTP